MGRDTSGKKFVHMRVHDEDAFDVKVPIFVFALLSEISSCLYVPESEPTGKQTFVGSRNRWGSLIGCETVSWLQTSTCKEPLLDAAILVLS